MKVWPDMKKTNRRWRVLLAGGGTAGHLYPGLAVAEALVELEPDLEVAFSVTSRAIDRCVLELESYRTHYEDVLGFSPRPWHWPKFTMRYLAALRHAKELLRDFSPQAVVGLGGFGSFAPVYQAQRMGLPSFVLNPDVAVGRANKRLAARATVLFAQFAETASSIQSRGRKEVVGCPIRSRFLTATPEQGHRLLGTDPARKLLLVAPGSSGAKTVNAAMVLLASRLKHLAGWQVVHVTGRSMYQRVRQEIPASVEHYQVRDYVDDMPAAFAAADLVLSRAGAGTVAELTAVGLPSVLMPYPFHRDQHQRHHAEILARAGAAVMVTDAVDPLQNADALWKVLPVLMEDDARRSNMAESARSLGKPQAAHSVAQGILDVLKR